MVRQRRSDRRWAQEEGRLLELVRQASEGRRLLRPVLAPLLLQHLDIGITPEAGDVLMTVDRQETDRQGTTEVREGRGLEAVDRQTVDRISEPAVRLERLRICRFLNKCRWPSRL